MLRSQPLHGVRWRALAPALLGLVAMGAAAGPPQMHWTVDPRTSLAWWQMSPHLNHLWATTCPEERSWRPGEGRSSGFTINPKLKLPSTGYANVDDTVHVPLYPRDTATAVCVEAVRGDVAVPDTVTWRGVRATVEVQGNALVTGEKMVDVMMHRAMQTMVFPEIQFTLGSLTVRGVQMPITAALKAFPDAGGLRVLVKWRLPATALFDLTPTLHGMALGLDTKIWHTLFMGADLVLRPEATAAH